MKFVFGTESVSINDDERSPFRITPNNQNISEIRRAKRPQLRKPDGELGRVSTHVGSRRGSLDLNPKEVSAFIFYDKNIVADIYFGQRNVPAAQ